MACLKAVDEICESNGWGVRSSSEGTNGVDAFAYSALILLAALTISATRAETFPPEVPVVGTARGFKLEWPSMLSET